jgi:hypothetical protein
MGWRRAVAGEIMQGFDDIFWKLTGWTVSIYVGAVTTALAFGIEPSLLG